MEGVEREEGKNEPGQEGRENNLCVFSGLGREGEGEEKAVGKGGRVRVTMGFMAGKILSSTRVNLE